MHTATADIIVLGGGGADIGGMAGAGEDDADVAEIVGQFGLG